MEKRNICDGIIVILDPINPYAFASEDVDFQKLCDIARKRGFEKCKECKRQGIIENELEEKTAGPFDS